MTALRRLPIVASLAILTAVTQPTSVNAAQAENGGVAAVAIDTFVENSDGKRFELKTGKFVSNNRHIKTGPAGHVQILINDRSTLTMGPASDLVVKRVSAGTLSVSLAKGTLRVVGDNVEVDTPAGLAVLHHGMFDATITDRTGLFTFLHGDELLVTGNGQTKRAFEPGYSIQSTNDGPTLRKSTPEDIASAMTALASEGHANRNKSSSTELASAAGPASAEPRWDQSWQQMYKESGQSKSLRTYRRQLLARQQSDPPPVSPDPIPPVTSPPVTSPPVTSPPASPPVTSPPASPPVTSQPPPVTPPAPTPTMLSGYASGIVPRSGAAPDSVMSSSTSDVKIGSGATLTGSIVAKATQVVPASPGSSGATIGVNVSGAEYSWMPFVGTKDLDFLKSQSVKLIRLNISWERMQPTLNGALDQTYLEGLKTVIAEASARGMEVLVDVHNYGRYNMWDPLESTCRHASLSIL